MACVCACMEEQPLIDVEEEVGAVDGVFAACRAKDGVEKRALGQKSETRLDKQFSSSLRNIKQNCDVMCVF